MSRISFRFSSESGADKRKRTRNALRLLNTLVAPHALQFLALGLLVISTVLLQLASPLLIAKLLDVGIPRLTDGDFMPLTLMIIGYSFCAVVGAFLGGNYVVKAARVSQSILMELRRRLYARVLSLSLRAHEGYSAGHMIARQTSDIEEVRNLLERGLTIATSSLLSMSLTLVLLLVLDWPSGLVVLGSASGLAILMYWYFTRAQVTLRKWRKSNESLVAQFVETMINIRAVNVLGINKFRKTYFDAETQDYQIAQSSQFETYGRYLALLALLGNFSIFAVLIISGSRVYSGTMPIGMLLATVLYVRQFFSPAEELTAFQNDFQAATVALELIAEFLDEDIVDLPDGTSVFACKPLGVVDLASVYFSYDGTREVLSGISLHVEPGEIVALVGSSGAGKTTIAKLLCRFYEPVTGSITVDGIDLRMLTTAELRRAVLMVAQDNYLFSGTVRENIAFGRPNATLSDIEAAADMVGLKTLLDKLPNGFDTNVGRRGRAISLGMRQLITLSRAMLADPSVVILDEVTSALDLEMEIRVQKAFRSLAIDRSTIIIAHRLSTLTIADRIVMIENGLIVAEGSYDDFFKGRGAFSRLRGDFVS